jgi:hypothetical protein
MRLRPSDRRPELTPCETRGYFDAANRNMRPPDWFPRKGIAGRRNAPVVPALVLMKKVEDYRGHAEECRILARRARLPGEREMLLNMAHTWDTLATNRVDQIAREARIAASDRPNAKKDE